MFRILITVSMVTTRGASSQSASKGSRAQSVWRWRRSTCGVCPRSSDREARRPDGRCRLPLSRRRRSRAPRKRSKPTRRLRRPSPNWKRATRSPVRRIRLERDFAGSSRNATAWTAFLRSASSILRREKRYLYLALNLKPYLMVELGWLLGYYYD